jgi:serpin B
MKKITKKIIPMLLIASMMTTPVFASDTYKGMSAVQKSISRYELLWEKAPVRQVKVTHNELTRWNYSDPNYSNYLDILNKANTFGFELSGKMAAQYENENFIFSPYSVYMPLAALLNGTAKEADREELLRILGAEGFTVEDVNKAVSYALYGMTEKTVYNENWEEENFSTLEIANAIFIDRDETIKPEFAQTFSDYYKGSIFSTDFGNNEAAKAAINKWASDNTNGLIDDVSPEFTGEEVAAIANALYFKDAWENEFDPSKTVKDTFYSPTGEVEVDMMNYENKTPTIGSQYYEDDDIQMARMDFKNGGGMYLIMPKDGDVTSLATNFSEEYFNQIKADSEMKALSISMPKFEIKSPMMNLVGSLKEMGIPLFEGDSLNDGVVEYKGRSTQLDQAVQKAVIKVDEVGTTAAAVTVMTIIAESVPPTYEQVSVKFDKPFMFVLTGSGFGEQVLFTGTVCNPSLSD